MTTTNAADRDPVSRALACLANGERPGEDLVAEAFGDLMTGEATPARAAGLLMGLRAVGETGEELAGAVRALRSVMTRVPLPDGGPVIDTCGTGGGTVSTFNISTAAAVVAVAAGVRVAKHGNRSYTSRCGSADVLEALKVPFAREPEQARMLLEEAGLAFLFAPAFHPAMKHVAGVRQELGVPTIMNLVGPLANPAGVRRQVVGVADADRAPVVADAFARLEPDHVLVCHARVGMDEIAPRGPTAVWEIRRGTVRQWEIDPAALGIACDDLDALAGRGPAENASRIKSLLAEPGRDPAGRAAVSLNAGAALYVAGVVEAYPDGVEQAAALLDSGDAARALARLRRPSTSISG